MALRKSQLYASIWQSYDQLHGGKVASQYKDYVLTLLFTSCFKVCAFNVGGDTPCVYSSIRLPAPEFPAEAQPSR